MSKNNISNDKPDELAKPRVVTKYDRKMQKRAEEKAKAEREQRITNAVTAIVLIAIVCFALSFPIRSMIAKNKTLFSVGGENLTRVEFDYSYNTVLNNYVNNYSAYLGYFGLDLSKDLSEQTYSGEMTWKDYFEEMAVDSIKRSKSLKADGKAAGFEYDTTADYERFVSQQKKAAKDAGLSLGKYIKQMYGSFATMSSIKPFVEEALYVAAYYDKLSDDNTPSAEEVEEVYAADTQKYDSVDYRVQMFDAELPTAPTELADPDAEPVEEGKEYEPSDAEVDKAMADAKVLAEAAMKTIKTEGDLIEGTRSNATSSVIRDWLFDETRKAGDTTVLEDASNDRYYCVAFEKRYRNDTPTADVRIMACQKEEDALGAYGTWNSGAATEQSFIDLCNGEYADYATAKDGLLEGITRTDDIYEELLDWIFADGRKAGDCEVVTIPDAASFVVFYSGEGDAEWYHEIAEDLRSDDLNAYLDELVEKCEVQDPDGNLNYIKIHAAEEAAAAAEAEAEEAGTDTLEVPVE